jgi:hypothetical protein
MGIASGDGIIRTALCLCAVCGGLCFTGFTNITGYQSIKELVLHYPIPNVPDIKLFILIVIWTLLAIVQCISIAETITFMMHRLQIYRREIDACYDFLIDAYISKRLKFSRNAIFTAFSYTKRIKTHGWKDHMRVIATYVESSSTVMLFDMGVKELSKSHALYTKEL